MSRQRPQQRDQRSSRDTTNVDVDDRPAHTQSSALPEALQAFRIDAPVDEQLPTMRYGIESTEEPRVAGGVSTAPRRATIVPQPSQGRRVRLSSASPTSETFDPSTGQPQTTNRSLGLSRTLARSQTPPAPQHMPTTHGQPQVAYYRSRARTQYQPHNRAPVPPGRPLSALDSAYLSDLSTVSGASSAPGNIPPSHASQSADSAHSASSESPGMPEESWERDLHGREIFGTSSGMGPSSSSSSRRQAAAAAPFPQDDSYDPPPRRGGTGRRAHFPVSTLRGGSAMNRAQSFAYGARESSVAGHRYRETSATRSVVHDAHRYRETGAPSPPWSGSDHDGDLETSSAPMRRGRPRNARGASTSRSEMELVSPDSENPEAANTERFYAQQHSRSFASGQRFSEDDAHRYHSQQQAYLQRRDDPRHYPSAMGYASEGERYQRAMPLSPEGRHRMRDLINEEGRGPWVPEALSHPHSARPAYVPYSDQHPRDRDRSTMMVSPVTGQGRLSAPGSPRRGNYVFPAMSDERERPSNSMAESRRLPPLDPRLAGGRSQLPPAPYVSPSSYLHSLGARTPPAGPPQHFGAQGQGYGPGRPPFGALMGQAASSSAPSSTSMPSLSASPPFRVHASFSPSLVSASLPEREIGALRRFEGSGYPPGVSGVGPVSRMPPRLGTSASPRMRNPYPPGGSDQLRHESSRTQALQIHLLRDSPPAKRSRTLSPEPPSIRPSESVNLRSPVIQPRVSEGEERSSSRDRSGRGQAGIGARGQRHATVASESLSAPGSGPQIPSNVDPTGFTAPIPEIQPHSGNQEPFNESVIHPDLRSTPSGSSTNPLSEPVAGPSGLQRAEGTAGYRSAEEYELEESDDDDQGPDFVVGSARLKMGRRAPRAKIDVACDFCRKRKMRCDGLRPSCRNCEKKNEPCVYINEVRRRGPGKKQKKSEVRPRRARHGKEVDSGGEETTKPNRRRGGTGKGKAVDMGESDIDVQQQQHQQQQEQSMQSQATGVSEHPNSSIGNVGVGGGEPSTPQRFVAGAQVAEIYMPMSESSPESLTQPVLAHGPRIDDPSFGFPTPPPAGIGMEGVAYFPQASPYRQTLYLSSGGSPPAFMGGGSVGVGGGAGELGGRDGNAGPSGLPLSRIDPVVVAGREEIGVGGGGGGGGGRGTGEETPVSATTRTSGVLSSASSGEGEHGRSGRKRASKRAKRDSMEIDDEKERKEEEK